MTRLRSPAQRAPQTTGQATELLARYSALDAQLAAHEAERQREIAGINAAADALVVPIAAKLRDIVKTLKPWWAASIDALTDGKRKSIELGGCVVGYRISPRKVTHPYGRDDAAVEVVRASPYAQQVLRVSYSLDKPAILKLLESQGSEDLRIDGDEIADTDPESLAALGFASKQTEEFFVDRVLPKPIASDVVDDPDASAVE